MRTSGIPTLLGNHDAYLIGTLPCPPHLWPLTGLEAVKDRISADQRRWLADLPLTLQEQIDGKKLACFHASPWKPLEEYIYPDHASFDRFAALPWDYVCLGHTHHPMFKKMGRCAIVNPGSCGQPRHGDHRACAAIVDMARDAVEFLTVEYDTSSFIREARQNGVSEKIIHVLERSLT